MIKLVAKEYFFTIMYDYYGSGSILPGWVALSTFFHEAQVPVSFKKIFVYEEHKHGFYMNGSIYIFVKDMPKIVLNNSKNYAKNDVQICIFDIGLAELPSQSLDEWGIQYETLCDYQRINAQKHYNFLCEIKPWNDYKWLK